MATDATGTPSTNYSIPKFNTAVDAPSGLGGNAQVDFIDNLLLSKVDKPAGIVSGEIPVWNGSTWVRSSAVSSAVVNPAPGFGAAYVYATANADLSPVPTSWIHYLNATVGGTTVRSITPGVPGQRLMLRNSNAVTTLLHNTGGGIAGGALYLRSVANTILQTGDVIEFVYDGSEWLECGRDMTDTYQAYTPTWSSTGTQPVLGNGTLTARYCQQGKMITSWGILTMGSTTTYGTGAYLMTFPVVPTQSRLVGTADMAHAGARHMTICEPQGGAAGAGSFAFVYPNTWPAGAGNNVGQTTPWTWATGDLLMWNLSYEGQ